MSSYAWIITWCDRELFNPADTIGAIGPREVTFEQEELLRMAAAAGGKHFRMYDDDGTLYYEGWIIGDHEGFEPLDEFGTPDGGASEIHYRNDEGTWERL